jgi:DNA-binding transcriptional LysR family regulator
MNLWQLQVFCKVVQLKSFSHAGKAIHLSQPTVSSHVKDLENHFGVKLIDRLAREVLPTKAGELLYGYGLRMMALRDEMETALAHFHGKIQGRLVMGGSTIPGVYILPRFVGAFTAAYPDVTISLIIKDSQQIVEDTLAGEMEFGVVGARSSAKGIAQETLIDDDLHLVLPAGHRLADRGRIQIDALLQLPFIVREPGSGTLKTIQAGLARQRLRLEDLKVVAQMGSTAAVIQGIKAGVGISILSPIAVFEDLASGRLKALTIEGLNLHRRFYLTWLRQRSLSPLAEAFTEFLKRHCTTGAMGQDWKPTADAAANAGGA